MALYEITVSLIQMLTVNASSVAQWDSAIKREQVPAWLRLPPSSNRLAKASIPRIRSRQMFAKHAAPGFDRRHRPLQRSPHLLTTRSKFQTLWFKSAKIKARTRWATASSCRTEYEQKDGTLRLKSVILIAGAGCVTSSRVMYPQTRQCNTIPAERCPFQDGLIASHSEALALAAVENNPPALRYYVSPPVGRALLTQRQKRRRR